MNQKVKDLIQASIDVKEQVLNDETLVNTINKCVAVIVTAFKNGNKVLFCGNGGSASDAQHLAAYRFNACISRK
jgi:D-sedoheptulose 7-phosphate isomerase